jgi:GT2 family glycosyltransferase
MVKQKTGFVTDAYNLGLAHADGDIIAFLDDDAVPFPNWLDEHLKTYAMSKEVGGVSGIALSATARKGKINPIPKEFVYLYSSRQKYYDLPWTRPINGMSGYVVFFGRDGLVHHNPKLDNGSLQAVCPSLLHMGANMSVRSEAIHGIRINNNLILGFTFEQLLSYEIWQRGYKLFYNPKAKVLHIVHGESTGRFFKSLKRAALRDAEFVLTFSILKSREKEFSWVIYILGVITLMASRITKVKDQGPVASAYRIYGLLYGFVIGSASIISKTFGQEFAARTLLSKLL